MQPELPESDEDPTRFLEGLPSDVRERLQQTVVIETPADDPRDPRWCLYVAPEGEFPLLRVYNDPADMASAMQRLIGQDVSVFVLYGVPLRLTTCTDTGTRFLQLPDGVRMLPIRPTDACGVADPVPVTEVLELFEVETLPEIDQEHGWLGDPASLVAQGENFFQETDEDQFVDDAPDDDEDDDGEPSVD